LIKSPASEKTILQQWPEKPFEDQLSKDFRREKANEKNLKLEEIRNKLKLNMKIRKIYKI